MISRFHTRIVGARSGCDHSNVTNIKAVFFLTFSFINFILLISVVAVVSFQPFRFIVLGFSTCLSKQ